MTRIIQHATPKVLIFLRLSLLLTIFLMLLPLVVTLSYFREGNSKSAKALRAALSISSVLANHSDGGGKGSSGGTTSGSSLC